MQKWAFNLHNIGPLSALQTDDPELREANPPRDGAPMARFWDLGFIDSASQRLDHRLWMSGNYRQVGSRGAIRTAPSLLPILQSARVEGKPARGIRAAEACGLEAVDAPKTHREKGKSNIFRLARTILVIDSHS